MVDLSAKNDMRYTGILKELVIEPCFSRAG